MPRDYNQGSMKNYLKESLREYQYIHQWQFTDFLMQNPTAMVKDMQTISAAQADIESVHECDCCGKKWKTDESVIKILT